jgi:hypothetical protein
MEIKHKDQGQTPKIQTETVITIGLLIAAANEEEAAAHRDDFVKTLKDIGVTAQNGELESYEWKGKDYVGTYSVDLFLNAPTDLATAQKIMSALHSDLDAWLEDQFSSDLCRTWYLNAKDYSGPNNITGSNLSLFQQAK